MKIRLILLLLTNLIIVLIFTQCKKDETPLKASTDTSIGTQKVLETLSGIVTDELGTPVANVLVQSHGQTYITNSDGFYVFSNLIISNNRYVVSFKHTDYFSVVRSDQYDAGKPGRIDVQLISLTPSATNDSTSFMSNVGGTISVGTLLSFDFPADVFMYESGLPYTGRVHVSAAYSDPTANGYNMRTYGGDQAGINPSTNSETILKAFTGTSIELRDNSGEKLQLNPNMQQQVTFTMQIPPPLVNAAPSKINIYTFNNTGGLKMANYSGSNVNQAVKNGDKYQGALGHFSFISCELAYTMTAKVKGTVTDVNGNPVPGVVVKIGQSYAVTDVNGTYYREVPAGIQMEVGILDYFGSSYGLQNITPYNITVHNITGLPVTQTVTGKLVDCNGTPVSGHINISSMGSNNIISTYTNTGLFAINTPAGAFDFYAYGNGTHYDQGLVTIPAMGNITLCQLYTLGQSYAVLTGGPMMFTGYTHSYSNGDFTGYLYPGPILYILAGNSPNMDYIGINGEIDAAGTYMIGTNNLSIDVYINNPDGFLLETGTLQISRFDDVGGLIEGVFSGTATDSTQISGAFSVYRIQ